MYFKNYQIERFLTNETNYLQVGTLFHLLNDIMERNANSYGAGADYHIKQDLAWVLAQYEIDIKDWPKSDELVKVGTIPYSFKRMMGYRKYAILNQNNEVLMEGKGKFLLINIVTKAMIKPSQALLDKFTDAKKMPEALDFIRLKPEKKGLLKEIERTIAPIHIDVNNHMNNAYFVAIASEYLPVKTETIKKIIVTYKQEAYLNDQVTIRYFKEDVGIYIELLRDEILLSQIMFYQG